MKNFLSTILFGLAVFLLVSSDVSACTITLVTKGANCFSSPHLFALDAPTKY